jgi:hypothetical protein
LTPEERKAIKEAIDARKRLRLNLPERAAYIGKTSKLKSKPAKGYAFGKYSRKVK